MENTQDKNNFLWLNPLKTSLAFWSVLGMLVGFFVSRAVLSMSMMMMGISCLWGISPRKWFQNKFWILGVIWVAAYIVSGFWSHFDDYWNTRCQVKLPILLLPLAFGMMPKWNHNHLRLFTYVLLICLLSGCFYSLSFLWSDPEFYIKSYKYAHVLPTIPKNDHIRFSLMVVGGIIWCIYYFPFLAKPIEKTAVVISIIILSVYLHVLAAKTGLVAWYIFMICLIIYWAIRPQTRKLGILLLFFISFGSLAATQLIPTLKERIGYLKYTKIVFDEGQRNGLYSDMGRILSYDIALKLIKSHPLKGVGAASILDSMKSGYSRFYPDVTENQKLIPHNQILTVAVACGLPVMFVFIAWLLAPLFQLKMNRSSFFFFCTWLVMLVPLMVEPLLEVQFGVFVFLFFPLWQLQMLRWNLNDKKLTQ